MEHQQEQENNIVVSDEVLVSGIRTTLTLTSDGTLRWFDDQHGKLCCLCVEKQVLGLTTDGMLITINTVVSKGGGVFCLGFRGTNLVRTRFVFQALSPDSLRILSHNIQAFIDSLGNIYIYFFGVDDYFVNVIELLI